MPEYKGIEYKDFSLPDGRYFSELSEGEQEKIIEWVMEIGFPALQKLILFSEQFQV